jgi:hypothetical protein
MSLLMDRHTKMKTETAVLDILAYARKQAFAVLMDRRGALPDGWSVHFAVGWGLTIINDKNETIFGLYTDLPPKLPAGVRDYFKACATFMDVFQGANETIFSNQAARAKAAKRKGA